MYVFYVRNKIGMDVSNAMYIESMHSECEIRIGKSNSEKACVRPLYMRCACVRLKEAGTYIIVKFH